MEAKTMRKFRQFIAGLIVGAMLMSAVTVFADTQTIEAFFNNIKISIDGNAVELKDAAGNPVEPFIHEGTTYLPVRAIAEALGMEVKYNETTNTVELAKAKEVQELESLHELSPRATASILQQNPEVRDTIDENGYAIWKGKPVRLNKDYLDGKTEVELTSEAEEQVTTPQPSWKYIKEGNLKIHERSDGARYVTPLDIKKSIFLDGKDKDAGTSYKVDEESRTVSFYYKNNIAIDRFPLYYVSGNLYLIPYDDYKNNILPKLLEAIK
jgi:hypothetical protein